MSRVIPFDDDKDVPGIPDTRQHVTPIRSFKKTHNYDTPRTPLTHREEHLDDVVHPLSQLVSIRVVLITITIVTVIGMAIGLIVLSVNAQNSIVNVLSNKIQVSVATQIRDNIGDMFETVDTQLRASRLMFKVSPNFTDIPDGVNPFLAYPEISEYFWSIVRQRPLGGEAEFDFLDGRFYGMESIQGVPDLFWVDRVNDSLIECAFIHDLNSPISQANFSMDNTVYKDFIVPPDLDVPPYPWIYNTSRDFLNTCTSEPRWFDLYAYPGVYQIFIFMSNYISLCNAQNELVGTMAISIELYGISAFLHNLTTTAVDGKIFVMDNKQRLVSSSTFSNIFNVTEDGDFVQYTIFNTNEQWVRDVVPKLGGIYTEQEKLISINGTTYFLAVTHYNEFTGIDWYIVQLLTKDQFLGDSHSYFVKSIISAACVSAASILVVAIVTWATTKPLFILANDLQKMSQLDLEISDMNSPRLVEIGRLYKSVTAMYIALRSFKKFVPTRVISKIIKNRKEVTPELVPAKITIMFQDIEGFTSLSETTDPTTLAKLTGEFMETMTEIICRHGGTIDKYIGDCIMSLFNAPEELTDHQFAATSAAVECVATLAKKNQEWKAQYGCAMNCRIGINAGDVLIGNMGSDYRMNYTAFGDNVNIAARLEGVNKHFGSRILISKAVYSCFKGRTGLPFVTRKLAKVRVSGKSVATSVYEVRGDVTAATTRLFKIYAEALTAFKKKEFTKAFDLAHKALTLDPTDKATIQLLERIDFINGVLDLPDNWSYVEDLSKF